MGILTIGLNHTTAPVDLREKVVFTPNHLQEALHQAEKINVINEVAILSTCNRTELYCATNDDDSQPIIDWIHRYHSLDNSPITPYMYQHPDEDAVEHILRVASGLDSMILGEPQILGQLKEAYHQAAEAGTLGTLLRQLFQHSFSVAKQVRTGTGIGQSPVSVAFAAVTLAKQIFTDFSEQTALLIGAGETIELTARHLHQNGIGTLVVANRTIERAQQLAREFDGYAITLSQIPAHLAEADIVISSTASKEPLVTREMVKQALKQRKHQPIFMVDIAVPRDIEPEISNLDDIYLYTVDDLKEVIQENLKSRQEAAQQAEEIIKTQVAHFMSWWKSRDSVHIVKSFRNQALLTRDEIHEKAKNMLEQGKSPEEVLEYVTHTLTNKLIHQPTTQLRQAGFDGNEELLRAASKILGLDKE